MSQQGPDNGEVHIPPMSPTMVALFSRLADEAAKKTAAEMFLLMGLNPKEPLEAQSLFAELRQLKPADFSWVRRTRKLSQGMVGKALMTTIAAGVLGLLHAAWAGAQSLFGR